MIFDRIAALAALPYRYAVTGFETGWEECPLFTNQTRTWFGAKIVERSFKRQGLQARVYDLATEAAPGFNPHFEKAL
jgi:hypothetical protein